MILEHARIKNYGPFSSETVFQVDPDVTVLTGPNDVGKSSLIRLLARLYKVPDLPAVSEDEFNFDNLHDAPSAWKTHDSFGLDAHFRMVGPAQGWVPGNPQAVLVRLNISPDKDYRRTIYTIDNGKATNQGSWDIPSKTIQGVILPTNSGIRDTIVFSQATDIEHRLFRVALGGEFQFSQLETLSPLNFEAQLGRAEKKLNEHLSSFLPASLGISWALRASSTSKGIHCFLQDDKGGYTALGARGTGVRRMMAILAWLMSHDFNQGHWMILFDEPELSLHADSQHLLRRVLEHLGEKPNVQVIYSTHSPSMINVARPHAIRLLNRSKKNEKATTTIDNRPFADNYFPIRSSLGLTPADSLLYAPITIVVEGDTEVISLQLLLLKLADAAIDGFNRVRFLLCQTHFLDGMGDRYPFVCQMAKSQGAKVIIFLDGDKRRHLAIHKISETHPDVPVVTVDDGKEFEQLVPEHVYFQALADAIGGDERVVFSRYQSWEQTASLPAKMVFTKRVERWLETLDLLEPSKARVMRKAVELVDAAQVVTRPLRELIGHIERLLLL